MQKSFTKTGLKIGDKVETIGGWEKIVLEVFENTFVVDNQNDGLELISFLDAINEGWTILPEEPACAPSLEFIPCNHMSNRTICTWCVEEGKIKPEDYDTNINFQITGEAINDAIIKNNNELIEEIEKIKCRRCGKNISECAKGRWSRPLCTVNGVTWDEHVIGISVIDKIIESKNDLLSKE